MTIPFHEKMALYEESAEHIIDLLGRKDPHRTQTARKIIRSNMMKVKSTTLEELKEKRRAAMATKNSGIRSDIIVFRGLEIGQAIRDYMPTYREAKSSTQTALNTIGASLLIASVVLAIAWDMGAS